MGGNVPLVTMDSIRFLVWHYVPFIIVVNIWIEVLSQFRKLYVAPSTLFSCLSYREGSSVGIRHL